MNSKDKTLPLDYRSPPKDRSTGSSRLVRCAAAAASLFLLVVVGYFVLLSRHTFGGLSDWIFPIAGALAGAVYLLLVALNISGRTAPKRSMWMRRMMGLGIPILLIPMAIGMVQDVLADSYARTRDRVAWIAAAAVSIAFSMWLWCLTYVRWNRSDSDISGQGK
jgi:hypothetical protein